MCLSNQFGTNTYNYIRACLYARTCMYELYYSIKSLHLLLNQV